jgi:hypothetical protein
METEEVERCQLVVEAELQSRGQIWSVKLPPFVKKSSFGRSKTKH